MYYGSIMVESTHPLTVYGHRTHTLDGIVRRAGKEPVHIMRSLFRHLIFQSNRFSLDLRKLKAVRESQSVSTKRRV